MSVGQKTANLDALITQLGFTRFVIAKNTEGLTHSDSLVQPGPGGNCLNWVLGHIVASRSGLLELLGREPIWDAGKKERYETGSPPMTDPEPAIPFEMILEDFERCQEPLVAGLRQLSPERLAEKAPFSPTNDRNETVGSLVTGFVFHEAYHAGQTGILRRLIGKDGAIG